MRLLNTVTGQFVEINDPSKVEYAILSHTWTKGGHEQSYQELYAIQQEYGLKTLYQSDVDTLPPLSDDPPPISVWSHVRVSTKIKEACEHARAQGYRLMWIDSCCIDRTSSSELSEAINSMFAWYSTAAVCFAYLEEVPNNDTPSLEDSAFSKCRWFTRGWTLQELIAPRIVVFLSKDWKVIGTKTGLARAIEKVTHVDRSILIHQRSLKTISVATRMYWASKRETTRPEDRAYSLLGIFDISMPTLYGEGDRAFLRLQEVILGRISDQSIFVWGAVDTRADWHEHKNKPVSIDSCAYDEDKSILAPSPSAFSEVGKVRSVPYEEFALRLSCPRPDLPYPTYSLTSFGLHTHFPVVALLDCLSPDYLRTVDNSFYHEMARCRLAILACERIGTNQVGHFFALVCHLPKPPRISFMDLTFKRDTQLEVFRSILVPPQLLKKVVRVEKVYAQLADPPSRKNTSIDPNNLKLAEGSDRTLDQAGYRFQFVNKPAENHSSLVLSRRADNVTRVELVFRPVPEPPSISVEFFCSVRSSTDTSDHGVDPAESFTPNQGSLRLAYADSKQHQFNLGPPSELYLTVTITTAPALGALQLDLDVHEDTELQPTDDGGREEREQNPVRIRE